MIKRSMDFLMGLPMTIAGGVFLAASLVLMLTGVSVPLYLDPAWVTVAVCGAPLLYLAVFRIVRNRGMKKISSALLISIAMIASVAIGELFAAGEVAFIMAIGAILEDKTVERAKKGLRKLIDLAPPQGRRIRSDGSEETVATGDIRRHDILRVLPGEAIPVDGEILTGDTSVDQSILTGESLPVDKSTGDPVFCGTINRFGAIDIRATRIGEDSSLQKLIRMVREAENRKAPTERLVDKWAAWLVPIALLIAVVTFLITRDTVRAVTILVVFCPCALVLATPTAIMAAIGQATKYGVIIKSGEALENMGKADLIAFDKTGTLTRGTLSVSDVVPFDPSLPEEMLLSLAASVEAYSEHPLAKAVVDFAQKQHTPMRDIERFQMLPGKGVRADIDGRPVLCGSGAWLEESGVTLDPAAQAKLDRLRREGKAAILVARSGACLGAVGLSDTLRESSPAVTGELERMGAQTVLLTGDHATAAAYFASQAGISTVYADLLPEQKVEKILELQEAGKTVCMIGDGVNDAPALKTAHVGVAMGGMGSDMAVDAADIALMGDDIGKIPYLKRLSRAALKTIGFSITLSMTINVAAIVLSVLGLLNPITGALVHNAGSVFVVLIAALLYDRKFL